jgi:hypothetical protein
MFFENIGKRRLAKTNDSVSKETVSENERANVNIFSGFISENFTVRFSLIKFNVVSK